MWGRGLRGRPLRGLWALQKDFGLRASGEEGRMLEVHIPSVGPEAEAPRQSPEKGHMVSEETG